MIERSEEEIQKAWRTLRAEIPEGHPALKQIPKSVYGIEDLTSVSEWYLWELLEQSKLGWELRITNIVEFKAEQRLISRKNWKTRQDEEVEITFYLVGLFGVLTVGGRSFPCAGGGDNRRIDGAFAGAVTSLFKNGCKWAGITMSLYKEGKVIDSLDEEYKDEILKQPTETPKPPVNSASATIKPPSRDQSDSLTTAMRTFQGKIVAGRPPASNDTPTQVIESITEKEFESNPANIKRIEILQELNQELPKPNSETWVPAMVKLFLMKSETNTLNEEMKQFGRPLNWTLYLLRVFHKNQCGDQCPHIATAVQKLKETGENT